MVNDPRVTAVLARLGGVYRDPARVDRDASTLLKSSVGATLAPISATRVENNGYASTVLVLQGTIAIFFRGNTYQVLVDIYLPAGYPIKPPVPYVRLAENMYLTENHKHVGQDGQVYLPMLHEWKASRDNLIELVVAMSSVFSNAPPVFTREAPPPPPPFAEALGDVVSMNSDDNEMSLSTREAILAAEAAEANAAAAAARAADEEEKRRAAEAQRQAEEERRRAEAAAAQASWQAAQTARVRADVVSAVRSYLAEQSRQVETEIQNEYRNQQRLEHAAEFKIKRQMEMLQKKKQELNQHCVTVDRSMDEIKAWIAEAEASQDEQITPSADEMVVASSPLHAQMMDLSAENWAISDALYFLDKALYQGHLDCVAHQKQVRLLAKRQFLVRAHLIKINEVLFDTTNSSMSSAGF